MNKKETLALGHNIQTTQHSQTIVWIKTTYTLFSNPNMLRTSAEVIPAAEDDVPLVKCC